MNKKLLVLIVGNLFLLKIAVTAQSSMINIESRAKISLNGEWQSIIDPTNIGEWRQLWKEKQPVSKTDFFEYSFEGGTLLKVPGDFNTQQCELTFYEGVIWYKKIISITKMQNKRRFISFGAVNYRAEVYFNGTKIGSHEGGFTPFMYEITELINDGNNTFIVKVNNTRLRDGIPALGYDWMNFGGITRDVYLIETGDTYIDDYSIQLKKGGENEVAGWIRLNGAKGKQKIEVVIPELDLNFQTQTNSSGYASINFKGKFQLWNPENPKLYEVFLSCETDTVRDEIGFRSIETKGQDILLNGKPIFLKAVNVHEEMPLCGCKTTSANDAEYILGKVKELGCNMVRLAHYPHNEYMVKLAERMGIMVWSEIPVYQHINFTAQGVADKIDLMMREMIKRDKNRCAVIIWSLSNETYSFTPGRDSILINLSQECHQIDSTRLITSVINIQGYNNNIVDVWDSLYKYCDIISVNEYYGWYVPWQGNPEETKWELNYPDKPLFISEFGGEAQYGNHTGSVNEASWWNEEYQEQIYIDQINMFKNMPNLAGVCPWILFDYRSPGRLHPIYQQGYNRKGLLSERGERKKAWYIMKSYYESK